PGRTSALGASPSLVANVVVGKFDDHLPLYRQEEIFRREGYFLCKRKLTCA
ncbi:MAG: transposase, partial [Hydrogenovibrio sp.]